MSKIKSYSLFANFLIHLGCDLGLTPTRTDLKTTQKLVLEAGEMKMSIEECDDLRQLGGDEACADNLAKLSDTEKEVLILGINDNQADKAMGDIRNQVEIMMNDILQEKQTRSCLELSDSSESSQCLDEGGIAINIPNQHRLGYIKRREKHKIKLAGESLKEMTVAYEDVQKMVNSSDFSEKDCATETGDGNFTDTSYIFCREHKLINALEHLAKHNEEYANYFYSSKEGSVIRPAGRIFSTRAKSLFRLAQTRRDNFSNFIGWLNIHVAAYDEGKLPSLNASVASLFTLHTKPEFWLEQIRITGDAFGEVVAKTLVARQRYIGLLNAQSDSSTSQLNNKITKAQQKIALEKAQSLKDSIVAEKAHLTSQETSIQNEINKAGSRLSDDYKSLISFSSTKDTPSLGRYMSVNKMEDLKFQDRPELPDANGSVHKNIINTRIGESSSSKVRINIRENVEIIANGVYDNLSFYQRQTEVWRIWANCFLYNGRKTPSRNRKQWRDLCSERRNLYGAEDITRDYLAGYSNPQENTTYDHSAFIYRPCEDEIGLCIDEKLTERWANKDYSVLRELDEKLTKEQNHYYNLLSDMNSSVTNRSDTITTLNGYSIVKNDSQSWSEGRSKSTSSSFNLGISYVVSAGYGVSVSKGSSEGTGTSVGAAKQIGFYHENAVSQNFKLGQLLAQCLDKDGVEVANGDRRFFGVGTEAFFDIPEKCHYIQLFINDKPSGIGKNTCIAKKDEGSREGSYSDGIWTHKNFFFGRIDEVKQPNSPYKPMIENRNGRCSHISKNFVINIEVFQDSEGAALKVKEIIDNNLPKLGKDISQSDNAYQEARNFFRQKLKDYPKDLVQNGLSYVDNWVSVRRLEDKKKLLTMQKSVKGYKETSLIKEIEKINDIDKFIESIDKNNEDKAFRDNLNRGFHASLLRTYESFSDYYLRQINDQINLYMESVRYHRPKLDPEKFTVMRELKSKLSDFMKNRISQDLLMENDIHKEVIEIDEQMLFEDSYFAEVDLNIGKAIISGDFSKKLRDQVEFTSVEHCSKNILKTSILGEAEFAADLKVNEVPMIIKDGEDFLINPSFDFKKACYPYGPSTFEYSECEEKLATYAAAIRKKQDAEIPEIIGYKEVFIPVEFSSKDENCLSGTYNNIPQILSVAFEYDINMTLGQDFSYPRNLPIEISPFSNWHGESFYSTFVNYAAHQYLWDQAFPGQQLDIDRKQLTTLSLNLTSAITECYGGDSGFETFGKKSCYDSLIRPFDGPLSYGPMTHMRPDTDLTIILPMLGTNNESLSEKARVYKNLEENLSKLDIHYYFRVTGS